MPTATRNSRHIRELTEVFSGFMRDMERPRDLRRDMRLWARDIRLQNKKAIDQDLRDPGGEPVHPDAASWEIPDEIILTEACFAVVAAPWLEPYHATAKSIMKEFHCGFDDPRQGTFSWNMWLGGTIA